MISENENCLLILFRFLVLACLEVLEKDSSLNLY